MLLTWPDGVSRPSVTLPEVCTLRWATMTRSDSDEEFNAGQRAESSANLKA